MLPVFERTQESTPMYLDEQTVGDCRIYGAATPAPGGYFAGVAVHRLGKPGELPQRVYINQALYDESVFACPDTALRHAMESGRQAVQDFGKG